MTKNNSKSIIQFIILLGIGVVLVWLSFKSVWADKDKIIESFQSANYVWVAISLIISFLSHFLRAYRWNYLLKPTGHSVTLFNATADVLVGYFANYGLPRMGEITRCTLATKYDNVPFEIALGTVITERIIDMLLMILIFVLTLIFQFSQLQELTITYIYNPLINKLDGMTQNPFKLLILIGILILCVILFFILRKKYGSLLKGKLGAIISGFAKGLSSIKDMENKFQFIVLSILIWAAYFYSLYACFYVFSDTARLGHSECLALLLFGTFGVVLSPGGLGAYPAIVSALLMYYGINQIAAFSFPWISWTSQFVMIIVLGLLSLILLPLVNKQKNNDVLSETEK